MDDLRSAIHASLRSGDVFTRSSAVQFLILLPSASYENGVKVCQRILSAYQRTSSGRLYQPEFSLLPVLPSSGKPEKPFSGFVGHSTD